MRRGVLAAGAAGFFLLSTVAVMADVVSSADASRYIGEEVTIEGPVAETAVDGKSNTTFIDFDTAYPHEDFTAVMFDDYPAIFGDVSGLEGRTVRVTGTVQLYKGRPEIILKAPEQLSVLQVKKAVARPAVSVPKLAPDLTTAMKAVPAQVSICFTPGEDCEADIVGMIAQAESTIRVQAYGFTSVSVLTALRAAVHRGVDVQIVLDKSDAKKLYGPAGYMALAGAQVFIDDHPGIAHSKVIVIDGRTTIGGSFNYTKSAATRNRENVTFISSAEIAQAFLANWDARKSVSTPFHPPTLHGR